MQVPPVPYCGAAPLPAELLSRWNPDPLPFALVLAALVVGRALGARTRPLAAGCALALVLFVSPLCAWTSALLSVRETHHLLLTAVVAPLFARASAPVRTGLAPWTLAHALTFWAWHAPPAYAWALASDLGYWAMQASLLGTAVGLWRAVLGGPAPAAIAALLATMVQMGLLGALLTFSGAPLYAWHVATTQAWGLSPLADQQLAGLIMWIPGAGLYLAAALWLANGWLTGRQRALPA